MCDFGKFYFLNSFFLELEKLPFKNTLYELLESKWVFIYARSDSNSYVVCKKNIRNRVAIAVALSYYAFLSFVIH